MRLLDLFCGAGGAAMGYHRAGFDVVGVDIKPQPHYPFPFIQGDALNPPVRLEDFDVIHASPPCQAYSAMKTMWNAREHLDLVGATRNMLLYLAKPYIIENVEGAPLVNPIRVCGGGLGLRSKVANHELRRHRLFEVNGVPMLGIPCAHYGGPVIGIYGDHARSRRGVDFPDRDKVALASEAMDINWMTWDELKEAIPPAYTRYIGEQVYEQLERVA